MAPILINEDMFKPGYNALKIFTFRNHNCFCTNLILSNSSTLATYCKELTLGKASDAGRDWGQEEKGTTEDEMAGWNH